MFESPARHPRLLRALYFKRADWKPQAVQARFIHRRLGSPKCD